MMRNTNVMSKVIVVSMAVMGLLCTKLCAQQVHHQEVVKTEAECSHMYLDVEVPGGDLMIKSSGSCGMSIAKMAVPDSGLQPSITTRQTSNGNHLRKVQFQAKKRSTQTQITSNLRTSQKLVEIDSYTSEDRISTEYHHDPNLSTDLSLQLGMGRAKMDLSGMTLQNFSVRSAFSDVFVTYRMPNQARMKKMDIHATKAAVVLDNIEKAKAELVSVQNDMGDTRLTLGDGPSHRSTIYLQSGVGNCTLVIHDKQPVIIILKRGMFSNLDNQGNFEKLQDKKEVFVNQAYHDRPEAVTKIICSLDLGNITLVKN